MKRKSTCRQTFEIPLWRKQATILNAPLAASLAATILNAALYIMLLIKYHTNVTCRQLVRKMGNKDCLPSIFLKKFLIKFYFILLAPSGCNPLFHRILNTMIRTCKHKYLVHIITFSKFVLELEPRGLALTAGAGVTDEPDPQPVVGGHELQG